jgi:uncharacterized lipoprotein YajG
VKHLQTLHFLKKLSLALLACLFFNACTIGTRNISLNYSSLTPQKTSKKVVVYVEKFKDEREDKETIGNLSNFFKNNFSEVKTTSNISKWVSSGLKEELQREGFEISNDSDSRNKISGKILKVSSNTSLESEGKIEVYIAVKIDNKIVSDKVYQFSSRKFNLRGTPESFEKSLEDSLRGILGKVTREIDSKI